MIQVPTAEYAVVLLPDKGRGNETITVEVVTTPEQMREGLMFADCVPRGTGMLFVHTGPRWCNYTMDGVKVPLDILWLCSKGRNSSAQIVRAVSADPDSGSYGGYGQFVLRSRAVKPIGSASA